MKLYETKGFPNPLRVAIALEEKGVAGEIEYVAVDVMAGEHRTPEFVAKNPLATVPVLELDDGTYIGETTAITEYIDHHFTGISLTGDTPRARAVTHMMQRRAEAMGIDAVGAYFHHATEGLGPELETYQNQDWGNKQREKFLAGLTYFNQVLADQLFLAGDHFTMADITLFAALAFADFAQVEIDPTLTHLAAWQARVASRESVKAATANL